MSRRNYERSERHQGKTWEHKIVVVVVHPSQSVVKSLTSCSADSNSVVISSGPQSLGSSDSFMVIGFRFPSQSPSLWCTLESREVRCRDWRTWCTFLAFSKSPKRSSFFCDDWLRQLHSFHHIAFTQTTLRWDFPGCFGRSNGITTRRWIYFTCASTNRPMCPDFSDGDLRVRMCHHFFPTEPCIVSSFV